MSPLLISMIVITIIWLWANSKSGKSEKKMKYIQEELYKDYHEIIDLYKKTWTFDDLDFTTNEKAGLKFSYETFYTNKNSANATKWWGLLLFFGVAIFSSLILWQISPFFVGLFAPSWLGTVRFDSALNILTILIPVLYQLYLYFGNRFKRNAPDYADLAKKDMFKIYTAVAKLDEDPADVRETRIERLKLENAPSVDSGTNVIHDDVVHGKKIVGDVIRGNVIVNGKPQKK